MSWRRRDVEIAANCTGATLSLTGEDGTELFEGVDSFECLGRILHRADEDWPAVLWNVWRARQVLGWLGNLLRREVVYLIISAKFYRVLVQVVLLYGSKNWVLKAGIMQNLEGVHVSFLQQVTGKQA